MADCFIGVDVGTGSARAGVFSREGQLLGVGKRPIEVWKGPGDCVEQSSRDIWQAVSASVREAVSASGRSAGDVAGIAFDATCSLVVLGEGGAPLPAGASDDPDRNIIVWMDHRATEEAAKINRSGEKVLEYVGGVISPEMETPKLLWLALNRPEVFAAAWQFMDLADFLSWRATGSLARSTCTVTCKWTYLAHEQRWDPGYFHTVGLGALADEGFRRIGTEILPAGTPVGTGLTQAAAADLGLTPGTAVGVGLIDAHAGGIGTVGAGSGPGTLTSRMAYVFGTSACTMASTREPAFVPGVWGPYADAMVPGLWLNEGGQSAAGAAIDHLVEMHPASPEARAEAAAAGQSLAGWLADQAVTVGGADAIARLVGDVHVVPEFLGNRAPFADPMARALIAGLGLERDVESLIGLYLAGVAGLGYGVRQIVETQAKAGVDVDTLVVSGGAGQHPLVRQILADATGLAVGASTSDEPVLLGSAILAAVAAGVWPDIHAAMSGMSRMGSVCLPRTATADWHRRRYQAFLSLQSAARAIRKGSGIET